MNACMWQNCVPILDVCMHACMHVRTHVRTYVYVCIYVCTFVCKYVCQTYRVTIFYVFPNPAGKLVLLVSPGVPLVCQNHDPIVCLWADDASNTLWSLWHDQDMHCQYCKYSTIRIPQSVSERILRPRHWKALDIPHSRRRTFKYGNIPILLAIIWKLPGGTARFPCLHIFFPNSGSPWLCLSAFPCKSKLSWTLWACIHSESTSSLYLAVYCEGPWYHLAVCSSEVRARRHKKFAISREVPLHCLSVFCFTVRAHSHFYLHFLCS